MLGRVRSGKPSPRSWFRLRPGRRLAAFAVALTLVFVSVGATFAWNGYVAKKHAAEREVEFVSRAAVVAANSFLARAEQTLETLATTEAVRRSQPAAMLEIFRRADLGGTFPGGISWLDARGRLVVATDLPLERTRPIDFSDRDHVRAVIRTRRPFVGRVVLGRRVRVPLFVVAVPTFTADGRLTGVLRGDVRLNRATVVTRTLTLGRADVRVADRYGTMIAGGEPNTRVRPMLDGRALAQLGGQLRPGLHVGIEVDGKRSVVSLARTARGDWWVAAAERESAVYAAARRTLTAELLGLGLLASLVVAASLSFASRMGRLYTAFRDSAEAERAARGRAELLQAVAARLATARDGDEVARGIVEETALALGAASSTVFLLSRDAWSIDIRAALGYRPEQIARLREALSDNAPIPAVETCRTGRVVLVSSAEEMRARYPDLRKLGIEWEALVAVPLEIESGRVGALGWTFDGPRTFDPSFEQLARAIAQHAALALERARLFEAERVARHVAERERVRVEGLQQLTASLAAATTVDAAVGAIVAHALHPLQASTCAVVLLDDDGRTLRVRRDTGYPPGLIDHLRDGIPLDAEIPVAHVLRTGKPLLFHDLAAVAGSFPGMVKVFERVGRAGAVLPLVGSRSVIGGIVLAFAEEQGFDRSRREELETFVQLCAQALERGQLYEAEQRLRVREHEIALRLQRALLPARLLHHDGVAVAARYEAGHADLEVGGDWYDTIALPGGRIGIAVGDVVGRGVAAAVAMGALRTAMAALAPAAEGAGALLHQLERFAESVEGAEFATACYAILDPATGELVYASAGHLPMLLVSPDGSTRFIEDGRSAPLCGLGPEPRPEARMTLEVGSTLLVFTDGLVERRRESLSDGLERLARAAADLYRASVDAMSEGVLARLTEGRHLHDDIALLCLRLERAAPRPLALRFPARPEELAHVRAAVRRWSEEADVPAEARHDLLLAVAEACANAVEHAYHGRRPGEVDLDLRRVEDVVHVTVQDFGTWRTQPPEGDRGRGIPIMEALSSRLERTTGQGGTSVRLRIALDARGVTREGDRLEGAEGHASPSAQPQAGAFLDP